MESGKKGNISNSLNSNSRIAVKNDTFILSHHSFKIYANGAELQLPTASVVKFASGDSNRDHAIFSLSTDSVRYFNLYRNRNHVRIRGKCQSFTEISGNESILKQTYLNTQNEYDTGLLEVSARAKSYPYFQMDWELSPEKSDIQISGLARNVEIAGNSVNFNFIIFLYENFSAICLAIFGTILTSYADELIKAKEKQ